MRPRILPPHYDKSPGVALFSAAVISPSIRTSWRDVALMFVVWCLIGGFELTHPREVHAQVSGLTDGSSSLSFADRKVGVVNQLRGLNLCVRSGYGSTPSYLSEMKSSPSSYMRHRSGS